MKKFTKLSFSIIAILSLMFASCYATTDYEKCGFKYGYSVKKIHFDAVYLPAPIMEFAKNKIAVIDFKSVKTVKQFDLVTHPKICKHLYNYTSGLRC